MFTNSNSDITFDDLIKQMTTPRKPKPNGKAQLLKLVKKHPTKPLNLDLGKEKL